MHRLIALLGRSLILIGCVVVLASCNGDQGDLPESTPTDAGQPILTVFGPNGSKAAFDALQIVFENIELPYEMRVFEGNATAPGIQGVLDGTFDLMILMRRPQPDEPLAFIDFVRTPIAFFVNPSAGIHNLTRQQAAAVLSGEVTNWSELGGADQEIVVLLKGEDDTNTEVIRDYIMEGKPFIDSARVLMTDLDVLIVVDGMPGAVGYGSWAGKKYNEFVSLTKYSDAITLDGMAHDDPEYPLVSVVGIVYRPDRQSFLQPLFDWGNKLVESGPVKLLIEQFGLKLVAPGAMSTP